MRWQIIPVFLLFLIGTAQGSPAFPELSGRVVDAGAILSESAKHQLTATLSDYESASTNQVVVVTLPSLGNASIEEYGYQLGRRWGIGDKGKNNGVLLIIAPKERKVRIEVGYGLEGTLTDSQCSVIVNEIILPAFRNGSFDEGILAGTNAILAVLKGEPISDAASDRTEATATAVAVEDGGSNKIGFLGFALLFALLVFVRLLRSLGMGAAGVYLGGSLGGSGGGFGGFSGGGGSFGGGGASGGW